MQYEIIATVRLVIIAEILGLIAAELRRSVQICNFSRHSSRKRSTTVSDIFYGARALDR